MRKWRSIGFDQVKLMLLSCLCFNEEISQLQLRRHILKSNGFLMTMRPGKEGIDTDMLGKFMLHRIGVAASQEIPKSANNHRSHTISVVVARAQSSAFVLE
jgi:hypothetical protein